MKLVDDLTVDIEELASANVSKFFRHSGSFQWNHVTPREYKSEESHWQGVVRHVFAGETGESPKFHVRYFEIEKGGYSTLEHHEHEHVVVVMRGQGYALVGDKRLELGFGDVLYVAPHDVHQLSHRGEEPFGFLCVVNSERDRPVPVDLGVSSTCD